MWQSITKGVRPSCVLFTFARPVDCACKVWKSAKEAENSNPKKQEKQNEADGHEKLEKHKEEDTNPESSNATQKITPIQGKGRITHGKEGKGRTPQGWVYLYVHFFPLNIMLRVSFSPARDCACRHYWISSFWIPSGKRPL